MSIYSCQETITDFETGDFTPRLVIEASLVNRRIAVTKGYPNLTISHEKDSISRVRISQTIPYGSLEDTPSINNATVLVENKNSGDEYAFFLTEKGEYIHTDFLFVEGNTYQLTVHHEGETYTATYRYKVSPDITKISQSKHLGLKKNQYELLAYFSDPLGEDYYYFKTSVGAKKEIIISSDQLSDGNELFFIYEDNDLKIGDFVFYSLRSISQEAYTFFSLLSKYHKGGGLFSTPNSELKGNIQNKKHPNKYPYGFFGIYDESFGVSFFNPK